MSISKTSHQVASSAAEFQLNCSVLSNPLPKIFWFFKSNEIKNLDKESLKDDKISEWKPLNLQASYSIKHSSNDKMSLMKLSLSKYHIEERHLKPNFVVSSLLIKVIKKIFFNFLNRNYVKESI